jgi:hypothetical protein
MRDRARAHVGASTRLRRPGLRGHQADAVAKTHGDQVNGCDGNDPADALTSSRVHPVTEVQQAGVSSVSAMSSPAAPDVIDSNNVAADGEEPLLYTPEQAARSLQVRPSWLRRKAGARAVPCRFVGKHLRFSRTDITAIADAAAQPPHRSRRVARDDSDLQMSLSMPA